jgi:predicted nucleotidyltransferase
MIIEKESEIKVLRTLCGQPFEYFSIADISAKANISRNWVYRIMKKFEGFKILDKSGKRHKLDFTNLFCKRLKLLFDSENLDQRIINIANKIIFETKPKSVVLVGSVALGKQKKESDIDFLVISEEKSIPHIENCNIILLNEKEFKEKYLSGDDFIISALLFGRTIHDNNLFIRFFENPLPIFSQQVIQEKIRYCERLEERIYSLLRSDEAKAREELLYLALQTARIILLRNKIPPKTKYDVAQQVRPFDRDIANIIKELIEGGRVSKERMLGYIKVCRGAR